MEKGWRMAKKPFFLDKFQSHEKNRKKGFMLHCIRSADSFVQLKNRRIGRFLYYGIYSNGQKRWNCNNCNFTTVNVSTFMTMTVSIVRILARNWLSSLVQKCSKFCNTISTHCNTNRVPYTSVYYNFVASFFYYGFYYFPRMNDVFDSMRHCRWIITLKDKSLS